MSARVQASARAPGAPHLRCARCGARHAAEEPRGLCGCGGTLVYEPALEAARARDPRELARLGPGPRSLRALLPAQRRFLSLGEGGTPLRPAPALGRASGIPDLWIKDETVNPSGSFKDRGLALAVGRARELGIGRLALATAGNAGVSAALYARAAGLALRVVVPRPTPAVYVERMRGWGAQVDVAGDDLAQAGAALRADPAYGECFDISTLREPYRVEGKKIIGYEILLACGSRPPDWIVLPTGGGTALLGVDKALTEMHSLGWLRAPAPRLAAAQAQGCAPVARAFDGGHEDTLAWERPQTAAWGLRVPAPFAGERILEVLRRRQGAALAVEEQALIGGSRDLWRLERVPAGLEAGAGVAAARALARQGRIQDGSRVVLLVTGTAPGGVDCPAGLV